LHFPLQFLSTVFSALAASKPGATREQAVSQGGSGVAAYDRYGGIVSGNWR
jgi:hypothetical protein